MASDQTCICRQPSVARLAIRIQRGWAESKTELLQCLLPFYNVHHMLTIQDEFVFKGLQIVVPVSLRKELIEVTHTSHIGIEACTQQARESLCLP